MAVKNAMAVKPANDATTQRLQFFKIKKLKAISHLDYQTHPTRPTHPMQFLRNQTAAPAPEAEVDVCPICMEVPKTTNVAITACGHKFCMSCLLSSLKQKNTCPACRAEIEPVRECIEPLPVSVASELIRTEEQTIRLNRRLAVINSFAGINGRSTMILSLCREVAFATAHSIARWQTISRKTYDKSWEAFDDDSDDDEQSGSDSGSEDDQ